MPDINPTPKKRFSDYKAYVDAHRELMQKPEVQRAFDFALMQMFHELADKSTDGNSAAANQYKMIGAKEFIYTVRNLAEVQAAPAKKPGERELTDKDHKF